MNKLSIAFKLGFGIFLVLVLFLFVSINSHQSISDIRENEKLVIHNNQVLTKILSIKLELQNIKTIKRGYFITTQNKFLSEFNKTINEIYFQLNDLKQMTEGNAAQQANIEKLKKAVDNNFSQIRKYFEIRDQSGFEASQQLVLTNDGQYLVDEIDKILDELQNVQNDLIKERNTSTSKTYEKAANTIIGLTIGAVIIVVLLIIYYTRHIARPVKKLSLVAKDISEGKTTRLVREANRNDEIGQLQTSFISMQQYLQNKADQANKIAEGNLSSDIQPISKNDVMGVAFSKMIKRLRLQMSEISQGVEVLSSSSNDIMGTISQLSSTTAQTSTSISETTSTIEEVKQTAEVSNQRAKEVTDSAHKLSEISNDGYQSLQDTIEGMNKIKKQMESMANIVIQLSEKSNTIGEIATAVNDLTEQSNLLAVNASIEAAKAGEQGKGFSVVAQEIKHLAERSKESTIQIRAILSDIQKEISSAVMATEEGGKVIDSALALSSKASEVITMLAGSVEEASQANIQIAASSQQQLTGMDQITIAMDSINEASRQVSDITKQTENSVAQLNTLGKDLKEIMSQYSLK